MSNKEVNAEVDLVAFISLLSVLICALLLTAVWVHVGTLDVRQGLGGQASEVAKAEPTLYIDVDPQGNMKLQMRDAPRELSKLKRATIQGGEGKIDRESFAKYIGSVKAKFPAFNIALVQPTKDVIYENIITLMDELKGQDVEDLGIVPL